MRRIFVIIALVFGLVACSQPPKEDAKYQPVVNPHPKYFITYKGFIDPSLNKLVKLRLLTVYATTNPKCEKVINKFEGVSVPREREHYITARPNNNGTYFYKVALDKYLPGWCKWQVDSAYFNDAGSSRRVDYDTVDWFSSNPKKVTKKVEEQIDWSCSLDNCELKPSTSYIAIEQKSIPTFMNHILELNYYREIRK